MDKSYSTSLTALLLHGILQEFGQILVTDQLIKSVPRFWIFKECLKYLSRVEMVKTKNQNKNGLGFLLGLSEYWAESIQ